MESDNPVEMFRDAVITLTTKGNVEEYMRPIIAKLKNGITDMAVLNEMIDILFDHVCNCTVRIECSCFSVLYNRHIIIHFITNYIYLLFCL